MIIRVERGKTVQRNNAFFKATYSLEGDETQRIQLEKTIEGWILAWEQTLPAETVSNGAKQNKCKDCGRPIASNFEKCFNCHRKSQA